MAVKPRQGGYWGSRFSRWQSCGHHAHQEPAAVVASSLGQCAGEDVLRDDWVHVIVNDGGEPAEVDRLVAERADRYAGRCHVVHNNTSRGMEAASNQGVEASSSQFIAIHDDDDAWRPEFLRKTVAYMEANASFPKLAGVITHTERVHRDHSRGANRRRCCATNSTRGSRRFICIACWRRTCSRRSRSCSGATRW